MNCSNMDMKWHEHGLMFSKILSVFLNNGQSWVESEGSQAKQKTIAECRAIDGSICDEKLDLKFGDATQRYTKQLCPYQKGTLGQVETVELRLYLSIPSFASCFSDLILSRETVEPRSWVLDWAAWLVIFCQWYVKSYWTRSDVPQRASLITFESW